MPLHIRRHCSARDRERQVRIPRGPFTAAVLGTVCLAGMAGLWLVGLWQGAGWLPGGSLLMRENAALRVRVVQLQEQVEGLRAELGELRRLHRVLALAAGLEPLDPDVSLAGVGGRLRPGTLEAPGQGEGPTAVSLQADLDLLLRQARLQRQACQVMLDTLAARSEDRERLPSIRPVSGGWLTSGFGARHDPFTGELTSHEGLDISVPTGTPVRATAAGVVSSVRHDPGFGWVVRIDHGRRIMTLYAHLSRALVRKGQTVRRGQVIAESGRSGRVTAPHLHYEVRVDGRSVDPAAFILQDRHLP